MFQMYVLCFIKHVRYIMCFMSSEKSKVFHQRCDAFQLLLVEFKRANRHNSHHITAATQWRISELKPGRCYHHQCLSVSWASASSSLT